MDQNGFFRAVWRLNALILAVGGLLLLAFAGWGMFSGSRWEPTPHGEFAPVPKDAEKDSTYRLEPTTVGLKGESILSLRKWNESPRSYGLAEQMLAVSRARVSYFSALGGVNILAIDNSTGAGHWLFHGYRRAVLSDQGLTPDVVTSDTEVTPATALVIQTIDSDTNRDGELTEKDKQSLYAYRPGMQYAEKFLDADFIISREQTSSDSFVVVYERGRSAIAATYSVPDFKLKSEKPLPSVPN